MISESLQKSIFGNENDVVDPNILKKAQRQLSSLGFDYQKEEKLDQIQFKLPPLLGNNVAEHFHKIGSELSKPYLTQGIVSFLLLKFQ